MDFKIRVIENIGECSEKNFGPPGTVLDVKDGEIRAFDGSIWGRFESIQAINRFFENAFMDETVFTLVTGSIKDSADDIRYNRPEIHQSICDRLNDTYRRKNSDYGDSFVKVRAEYPEAILIRLSDKLERLKALKSGKVQMVVDESVKDTLIDLANYAILELLEMEIEEEAHAN